MLLRWNFWQLYLAGLSNWLFFGKGTVWDFWWGSEYNSSFTNDFLFYRLSCSIKVCLQIPFSRGMCCVETSPLICKANWLAILCMVQIFARGIFEQIIAQFYPRKQSSKSVLLFLYLWRFCWWWFCRLLACSFTSELLCGCFFTFSSHFFYRNILWCFLPCMCILLTLT